MERIKKSDEEKKEFKSGKKSDVKFKKAKETTKLDKENEIEEEI